MRPYQIMIDTNADTPKEYVQKKNIILVPQYTLLDGVTYEGAEGIDPADFYKKMAAGSEPQSQAINPAVCEEKFRQVLDAGKDLLYISFSSAMSSSYNTAYMTGENLKEEYPDAKIYVIDSLNATAGETLILMNAIEKQEAGMDIDSVAEWIENIKKNTITLFTVDTLKYLQRGGRISKTSAIVGTVAAIKPLMCVNSEGKLVAMGKERGRKKSLASLISIMAEKITPEWKEANTRVCIAHSNCIDDVNLVTQMIREKLGIEEFVISDINPSIGVHSGPGTICVSFFGTEI